MVTAFQVLENVARVARAPANQPQASSLTVPAWRKLGLAPAAAGPGSAGGTSGAEWGAAWAAGWAAMLGKCEAWVALEAAGEVARRENEVISPPPL